MPLNAPNLLTVGRILLIPVLVAALLADTRTGDLVAAAAFALGAATDALDGYLARSAGEVTRFGKLADPLADKLLLAAALVLLVSNDTLPVWVAVVINAREIAVTALRTWASRSDVVVPAQTLGKAKTVFQTAMVLAVLLVVGSPLWLDVLIDVTVALTLVSGADFVLGLRRRWAVRPSPAAPS